MDRDRRAPVAQGTWRAGSLHVWGWDGSAPASAAWIYGGFGRDRWSGAANDWHDSPISYGELTRLAIELPDGTQRTLPCVRLDPYGAAVWLSDTPTGDQLSDSLAWFARLTRWALSIVSTGNLTATLVDGPLGLEARWRPTVDLDHLRSFAHAAPPICLVGSDDDVADVVRTLVDGLARSLLHGVGWRPELGRGRDAASQARRSLLTALSRPDPGLRDGSDAYDEAVASIRRRLDEHARRLRGEPVVRPRVRLTVPADAGDPWLVDLELVDAVDPARWCAADDVWSSSPGATELAGDVEHLDVLRDEVSALADRVASTVPTLADLAQQHEPAGVELELDAAEEFLDQAPAALEAAGIELIGPEHLVKRPVVVRGRATSVPDDRRGRFGRDAIVEWRAVVDDTALSDAELARIETAGATLLHTGHRWVRIDPAGLRRARELVDDHRERRSDVGAVELLHLAIGLDDGVDHGGGDPAGQTGVDVSIEAGDDDWIAELLDGLPDLRLVEADEPPGFVGALRHYQRRGLGWMRFLADLGLGGCLADDMGLGKTATTLAHLLSVEGPHLVVCPLSVVHNWEAEAARFAPGLRTLVHHGNERRRADDLALFGFDDVDLVITTYGLAARDVELLSDTRWGVLVADEAQMVKNAGTRSARALRAIAAGQKLALTGTPVENRLAELWAILDLVNPSMLGPRARFRERFSMPIEKHDDGDVAEQLRTVTSPFVLRRTKADKTLVPELPDKIEQIAYATLTPEQASLYQQVVDQLLTQADESEGMQRRGRVLAALTRLKQVCNHPAQALRDDGRIEGRSGKLARFDELVDELLDVDARALVFTQFAEMGALLVRHLDHRLGLEVPFLQGGTTRARREAMVRDFQDGAGPPLLIVSLKAGGTGLNLTAASHVIHYDRWWNPAVEDQATDRAWRLGQRQTVNVHKLVCEGTVEERISEVIDEKRRIADAVVGTGETWLSELSTDDLRDLVSLARGGR